MADGEIVHRVRASVFAREAEWRLSEGRLFWTDAGPAKAGHPVQTTGESGVILLDEVASVRLTREPTRGGVRLFCRLRTREGVAAFIASAHHEGVLRAQDRSASYRTLVRAILAHLARRGPGQPQVTFATGAPPLLWWSVVIGLALLLFALAALFALTGGEMFTTRLLLGLALVALGAPNLIRWLSGNRPGSFDPANPPL